MKQKCVCDDQDLTSAEKWRNLIGTELEGNLPQYKRTDHIGHCWKPCPYSTQASDELTRALLGLSDEDTLPSKTEHVVGDKEYFMATEHRGSWGFMCTYDDCSYFLSNGVRYFHR